MVQLQLYIEGNLIDFFDNESVTLNQMQKDVRDINAVFSDYTYSFSIPASRANNKVFKHFYDYSVDGIDAQSKKDAELHLNYKLFKKGKVKIESVQMKNGSPQSYKITFFGNTIKIKDIVGEDKLSSLSILSTIDFTYNATKILEYMESGLDLAFATESVTDGIVVPLVTHTNRLVYDSGNTNYASTTDNVHYDSAEVKGPLWTQFKPAIKLHAIIKAIEDQYKLEGISFSDDFFSSDNSEWNNLYMWMHKEAENAINPSKTRVNTFGPSRGDTGEFGMANFGSNHVSILLGGNGRADYDFYFHILVTPVDNSKAYTVNIYENDRGLVYSYPDLTGEQRIKDWGGPDYYGNGRVAEPNGIYYIEIESFESNSFAVDWGVKMNKPNFYLPFITDSYKAYMITYGPATIQADQKFKLNEHLPEMKIIDFLSSVFKMFNLTASVDDDNIINVKTLDSFYEDGTTHDITEYVDTSSGTVQALLPYSSIDYLYEGTETFFAAHHKELSAGNTDWGSDFYKGDGETRYLGEHYKVKIPFEHHKFEKLIDKADDSVTDIQWGWSVDKDENALVGMPAVFYCPQVSNGTDFSIRTSETVHTSIDDYYVPSNSLALASATSVSNIHFKPEINEYAGTQFNDSLFQLYYRDYISGIFNPKKRLFTFNAILPERILMKLKLNDGLIIDNRSYKINKMTTNFTSGKTKFELINDATNRLLEDNLKQLARTADTTATTADTTQVRADIFEAI